jgi:hypothetical protein
MEPIKRRRFLAATAAATAGVTTGCTGNGGGDGDGEGDGNETAGGTENGGQEGQTGGEETSSETGGTSEGEVRFGDVFSMGESFAFDVEPNEDQGGTVSGQFYQGNVRVEFENEQGSGEFYSIDGDQYFVMEGEGTCIKNPSEGMAPEDSQVEPEGYESDAEEYADLTPTETTTVDGNQVYVFEVTSETTGGTETTTTYYVGVDSGNLRRVEAQGSVTNFHSWGEVEPIEAPDMECRDMSDMPSAGQF